MTEHIHSNLKSIFFYLIKKEKLDDIIICPLIDHKEEQIEMWA